MTLTNFLCNVALLTDWLFFLVTDNIEPDEDG
jgi:hypothetical protein